MYSIHPIFLWNIKKKRLSPMDRTQCHALWYLFLLPLKFPYPSVPLRGQYEWWKLKLKWIEWIELNLVHNCIVAYFLFIFLRGNQMKISFLNFNNFFFFILQKKSRKSIPRKSLTFIHLHSKKNCNDSRYFEGRERVRCFFPQISQTSTYIAPGMKWGFEWMEIR